MKKTYIYPTTEVVVVATKYQICIGSPNKETPTDLPGNPTYGGDNPGNFSRGSKSIWDEEHEDF